MFEDITIEMARIVRECQRRAEAKVRARQLGEAWIGLELQAAEQMKTAGLSPGRV